MKCGAMVVVEPCLDASGHRMRRYVYVEICRPVQVRDGDEAMHDSFKGSEPAVKSVVESLSAQPSEVCAEEDTTKWDLCQPSYTDHVGPDATLWSRGPV